MARNYFPLLYVLCVLLSIFDAINAQDFTDSCAFTTSDGNDDYYYICPSTETTSTTSVSTASTTTSVAQTNPSTYTTILSSILLIQTMTTSTLGVPESSSMSPIPPTSTSNSANRAHGLSSGAQAGIAIGTIMFVALTGTVVFFIWRRMRARKLNELLAVEVGKKRTEDDNGGTVMSELHGASMMSPKSHDAGNQSYQSCRSSSQQTSIPENSRISGPTLNNELFLPASDQLEVRRPHVFITNPDEPPKVDLPAQLTTETPVILGTGHQSFPVSPQGVAGTSINGSRNGDSQAEGSQTAFTISELHEEERWLDEQIEEAKRATNPAREIKRSPSVPCQSRREQDEITPVD